MDFESLGENFESLGLGTKPSSYLDNPLVGGKDGVQLHFGTSLFQEQHFVGFGGHGVAAGSTGQGLGQGEGQYFTGMKQLPAAENVEGD